MINFASIIGYTEPKREIKISKYFVMKGIKMFFGVLAAASLLFSVNAYAQENNNRGADGKAVRGPYETNKWYDNTFVGIGAGYNNGLYGNFRNGFDLQGKGGLAAEIYLGKWYTPAIGIRFGYKGLSNPIGGNFAVTPMNQHYLHGDFMWNMFHSFVGYKETRVYSLIPYASTGLLLFNRDLEYAAGVGLLNSFRLSRRINLNLDLLSLVAYGRQYEAANRFHFPLSATIGISVNLFKTNFDRHSTITPVVVPVPFTTEQYNALADKVAALEKENADLRDKISALDSELAPYRNLVNGQTYLYENGTFTAVDVKPGSPLTLYFDCGSTKLSAREQAHLEYFANTVLDGNTKLAVNGYADKQTGSARRNQQLSEQRVKTVVDLLTKAGANADNIETAAHGADVQLFDGAAKNRVVTIEVL